MIRRLLCAVLAASLAGCGGGGGGGTPSVIVTTYLGGANFPTNLRFAPDGRLFFTEKNTGQVRIVDVGGNLLPAPFATLPVGTTQEQGLVGLCLDPDFATNHYVYVFYSRDSTPTQRIARFTDVANLGTNFTVLLDNIPRGSIHNGGKLAFGLDGKLYATVGETGDPANSQSMATIAGKVLRMNPDGSVPGDNPFPGSLIFTLGHRNCFGMEAFPGTGTMYVSENGPTFDDEINRLVAGQNYGWRPGQPQGDTDPLYRQPLRRYPTIIAPTGIHFYRGSLFPALTGNLLMASFVEGSIRSLAVSDPDPGAVNSESVFLSGIDSPIDIAEDSVGALYIATPSSILRATPAP